MTFCSLGAQVREGAQVSEISGAQVRVWPSPGAQSRKGATFSQVVVDEDGDEFGPKRRFRAAKLMHSINVIQIADCHFFCTMTIIYTYRYYCCSII